MAGARGVFLVVFGGLAAGLLTPHGNFFYSGTKILVLTGHCMVFGSVFL
jgi:hypothetical protein